MTSFIAHTTVDCGNAYELSEWWKQVLEYVDVPDDPNQAGHEECLIQRPDGGHPLLFIEVPEAKQVKNRIHFDLRPTAGTREQEVARVIALGASQVADHRDIHGPNTGWVVLADPEGNEFCILRSEAERQSTDES
ncbi:MAG: VOC family protein [Marmoricola sp.]